MAKLDLLLDTNVIVDYLEHRKPFYEAARLLMICGRLGEFKLWISSSQITDLVYILSSGGARSQVASVLDTLRALRTFIEIYPVGSAEVDAMLATEWTDPEDALLYEVALKLKADALITRNQTDFARARIKIVDCQEFFAWMEKDFNLVYAEVPL